MDSLYNISVKWDKEASVWIASNSELGLVLECGSYDALIERVKIAIPELAKLNHIDKKAKYVLRTGNRQVAGV